MATTFTYDGHAGVGAALKNALVAAGYEYVDCMCHADFVFTYYSTFTALEDAYFDDEGVIRAAKKGAYLVDMSPATPNFTRELSAVASVSDLFFVEAPLAVSDTTLPDAFVDPENLICTVAGDGPDVTAVSAVLQHFAATIIPLKEAGSAQLAHAAWSLQRSAQLLAAVESEALYRAMRRIPTSAAAASEGEAAVVGPLEAAVVAAIAEKRFKGTFTVEMFMADLSAALTAADDADLILPQAEACMNLMDLLATIGGLDYAPAALALIYDEEEAASAAGLDWARAEEYSAEMGAHSHSHDDFDDFDDDDDFTGYANLFEDFSDN